MLVPGLVPHVAAASFDPWANGWQYRKQVTVDHSKVSAPLTNFPVLIDTTDSDLASKARSDGGDILFMDGVGSANKLDHEIESYTSGTGHLVAWVRIPTLSSTVDTVFYMYYGNPSAANQQNKVGVWDSRFVMVQHLSETTGTHYDSTSHHNDGTPTGGLSQGVAGKIDGADNFDGIDDRVDVLNNPDNSLNFGTGDFTLSVWIKYASCGDTDVTRKGNMNVSPQMSYKMECTSNVITATLEGSNPGGGTVASGTTYNDNNWHNAVFMRNAGTISLYVDGALKASQGAANMDLTSTANVAIGAKSPPPYEDFFNGLIDETRYSNVAAGSDWIITSYRSVTQQFVSYGLEEQKTVAVHEFTWAWLSDTQFYSADPTWTYMFSSMTTWIVQNHISYVVHTGDVVNDGPVEAEYQRAKQSMDILTSGAVPYGILAGNHDSPFVFFQQYFGALNRYDLVSYGGVKFIVVYLSYGVDSSEISWANSVFAQYPDRLGILATHAYLNTDGTFTSDGSNLYNQVVVPNSNIRIVLCGHMHGYWLNTKTVGSRTVYEVLADPQAIGQGGDAYLTILSFDTLNGRIHLRNYSTRYSQYGSFDQTISLSFPMNVYHMTASAGTHGSISPSGAVVVNYGADQAFTINPNTGYHIVDVVVDAVSQGAISSYTFYTVTADHAISASFAIDVHTITASAGSGGTISPSGYVSVNDGDDQSFTMTPDPGYHLSGLVVDGGSVTPASPYIFSAVTIDHTIVASFAISVHTIAASAGPGGTVSPSGSVSVNDGASQGFTISPSIGYHIADVLVDGGSVGAVPSYTFTNVQADHSIAASFTLNEYTLTVGVTGTGTVNRDNPGPYQYGDVVELTAVPGTGYSFSGWSGDLSGTENPKSITMNRDKVVAATFVPSSTVIVTLSEISPQYYARGATFSSREP